MRRFVPLALVCCYMGFGHAGVVRAGFLDGHDLTLQNLFQGSPTPGFTTTFTVDSTPGAIEVPNWAGVNRLSIDVFDTSPSTASILITGLSTTLYSPSPNLMDFHDTNSNIAPFLTAAIGATDVVGLDASRLSFTADTFSLDLGGLVVAQDQSVRLDLGTAAVPEPAGLVLLGTGAVGLLGYARRRRTKPAAAH